MPAVLALLSSVMWGSADFLGGTLTRRAHAVAVVAASQVLSLVLVLPFALATGAFDDPTGYLPWAFAAGVIGMVSLVAFYAALATGTMGVVAPIAATGVVVPVAFGLIGGDRPHALQLVGVGLAIAGVVLASGPEIRARGDRRSARRRPGAAARPGVCRGVRPGAVAAGQGRPLQRDHDAGDPALGEPADRRGPGAGRPQQLAGWVAATCRCSC